jgi:hypothetical protein
MFITISNVWDRSWRDEWNTHVNAASEAFVEGMNEVEIRLLFFFASLDLFISRVPYEEGFYFSITEVSVRS